MSGYVAMRRDWQDHDVFGSDEFSRRDAWAWLISHAAWKPTKARIKGASVPLDRGELCFAQRFLAKKWGWSKSKVDRFIASLRAEGMISTRSKIGATSGHNAGQGQTIITICNYAKYQSPLKQERGNVEPQIGATAGQQRGKEEEGNKGTIEPKEKSNRASAASYAFDGKVIRLTPADFNTWQKSFSLIDLTSRLQQRDDWLATEADEKLRAKWFIATSNWLAGLQEKARTEANEPAWDGMA